MPEKPGEKPERLTLHSSVAEKPNQVKEVVSLQGSKTQTWESLPHTAEIRLEPNIHSPVLQLIRRGTRLQVVGKQGDWLRLQLKNGNTGWIYHSWARPIHKHAKKPISVQKESQGTSGPVAAQPNVSEKANSRAEVRFPRQNLGETYICLPKVARIRSGPTIKAPLLQIIRRGTRLQVVGKQGVWLKLQLRNGSTGWIYHSLVEPEQNPAKKPLNVLKGTKGASEPYSVQPNMTKKARSAEEVLPGMENGSEVALFYPD
jgi:uncharacterized protein YgiM (DUF1202 family)